MLHAARARQALSSDTVEPGKEGINLTFIPTPENLDPRNRAIWRIPEIWGPGNSREFQRKA